MKRSFFMLLIGLLLAGAVVITLQRRGEQGQKGVSKNGEPASAVATTLLPSSQITAAWAASISEIPQLLTRSLSQQDRFEEVTLRRVLIHRWAEASPDQITNWALNLPKERRNRLIPDLFWLLAERDHKKTHELLLQLPDQNLMVSAVRSINQASPEGQPALLKFLATHQDAFTPAVFREAAKGGGSLIAELMPLIRNVQDLGKREAAWSGLLSDYHFAGPSEANALLQQVPNQEKNELAKWIGENLLERQPQHAGSFIAGLPLSVSPQIRGDLLREYGSKAPAFALNSLASMLNERPASNDARILAGAIARVRPRDVIALVNETPASIRTNLLLSTIESWAGENVHEAEAFISQGLSGVTKIAAMEILVKAWVKKDPAAAAQFVLNINDPFVRKRALDDLKQNVGLLSSSTLKQVIDQLPNDQEKSSWMIESAEVSARHNLPAAVAWAKGLPEGSLKNDILHRIAPIWATANPREAFAYFQSFPGEVSRKALEKVARTWAESRPEEALQFGLTQGGELQRTLMAGSLEVMAGHNPAGYVEALKKLPTESMRLEMINHTMERFSMIDPYAARGVAEQLPPGDAQAEALAKVARGWGLRDSEATALWMNNLNTAQLEKVIPSFVQSADGYRPDLAAAWASRLQNQELRVDLVAHSINRWSEKEAAFQWLQSSSLSEQDKQVIFHRLRPRERD